MPSFVVPFVCIMISLAVAVVGVAPVIFAVAHRRRRQARDARKSPLTQDLLRAPGKTLRLRLDDSASDMQSWLATALVIPLLMYAAYVSQSHFWGEPDSTWRILVSVVACGIVLAIAAGKMVAIDTRRQKDLLGLQGELATGQELDQLMREGCYVFHDVAYDYGNIDHVVVAPAGVFAVETKARGKPKNGDGDKATVRVDYGAGTLCFPDGTFPIPRKQLESHCRWLSQWLTCSTGQPIKVDPILALPGWFVERTETGSPVVMNPRKPQSFFMNRPRTVSDQAMKQVAHQLEQRCRTVPRVGLK